MEFWAEVTRLSDIYRFTNKEEDLINVMEYMERYIGVSAKNAKHRSELYKLCIPYEDFISSFDLVVWEALETYAGQEKVEHTFKNIVLFRMNLAEKSVWRLYKSNTCDSADKNGISYDSARWNELDSNTCQQKDAGIDIEEAICYKEMLKNYIKKFPKQSKFILLLLQGYTSCEASKLCQWGSNYDEKSRKRAQRTKQHFKKFLNEMLCESL